MIIMIIIIVIVHNSNDNNNDNNSTNKSDNSRPSASSAWPGRAAPGTLARTFSYNTVPFIPMPMPKPVCRTNLYNNIVQLEVCITFSGRGMGMNITAHILYCVILYRVMTYCDIYIYIYIYMYMIIYIYIYIYTHMSISLYTHTYLYIYIYIYTNYYYASCMLRVLCYIVIWYTNYTILHDNIIACHSILC